MTDPTPSTNDILSKIRAAKSAAAAESTPVTAAPAATAVPEAKSAETPAPAATSAPKSTADILAAARAKATAAAASAAPKGVSENTAAPTKQGTVPAPAGAPTKPADIMASIRAKAGAASAAAAAPAKVAAAPAAADTVAKAAAAVGGLSPAEMIRAARTAASGEVPAPKVVLPSKPLPGKAPAGKVAADVPRRSALADLLSVAFSPVVVAWASFLGALGASTLGLARFMMPNVLVEPPTKFKIGPTTDYAPGTVSTKWQAQFNIWVVNSEVDGVRSIYALSTVCTHLGCTPNWLEGEQKFKCPCHGSGFYKSGINFEGPAPRPLERVGLRLAEDGMLEVDKSVKFQRELGQWTNASSFVGVG
jgi:cytochrome b6-f complex iron-sulfur subunit